MTKIGEKLNKIAQNCVFFLYIFRAYSLKIFAVGGLGATAPPEAPPVYAPAIRPAFRSADNFLEQAVSSVCVMGLFSIPEKIRMNAIWPYIILCSM